MKYVYRCLDPDRYRFRLLAPDDPEGRLLLEDLTNIRYESVPSHRAPLHLALATRRLVGSHRPKLIHAHGLTAAISAILGAMGTGTPVVVTHHDVFRDDQFHGAQGVARRIVLSQTLRRGTAMHFVSNDSRDNFFEYFPELRAAPFLAVTIQNGIDVDGFRSVARSANVENQRREPVAGSPRPMVLGFLGRFMPQKGFDLLVSAVERLVGETGGPWPIRVLAVNDGAFVRELRADIERRQLSSHFEFIGFQASVWNVLLDVDVVVIPSRWEACPLVPMEAMVLGKPVIASDCVGLREVVRHSPTITFETGNAQALADAIASFRERRDDFVDRATRFAETARSRFDSRTAASALQALFTEVERRT